MTTMASQITSPTVVYSTVYSDADQRKHQSSASLAFVWGIHRDRWIPRTKGQLRGKCFHLMTSSWAYGKIWSCWHGKFLFTTNVHFLHLYHDIINSSPAGQNGCRFTDDNFKRIFTNEIFLFRFQSHWNLFQLVQLTILQYWFRQWLGAGQVTSHYLNQRWHSSPTHICGPGGNELKTSLWYA